MKTLKRNVAGRLLVGIILACMATVAHAQVDDSYDFLYREGVCRSALVTSETLWRAAIDAYGDDVNWWGGEEEGQRVRSFGAGDDFDSYEALLDAKFDTEHQQWDLCATVSRLIDGYLPNPYYLQLREQAQAIVNGEEVPELPSTAEFSE